MRKSFLVFVAVVLAVGVGVGKSPRLEAAPGLAKLDFRKVVKEATDKVFPAVVFIKCLRESHKMGKKISEEVSGSGVII
ncbi:MAG: hypothetical protein QF662_03585, partial [Phycisphaerae bacterium]|nr:hypothetical protein [Phycisphaerae bacterium]